MTTSKLRTKLEKNGYKVTLSLQGFYFARKGQQIYKAETITGLYNKIFKPIY